MCDPNATDCRCKRLSSQIATTLENISNLIAQAIKDPSVRHKNENLMKCWEVKKCQKTVCPAYHNKNLRCWQVAGTYCGDEIQGAFAQKYESCVNCKVFQAACAVGNEAINEQVNNLVHLLYEKDKKGEFLNKELMNTLNSLNRKDQKIIDMSDTDNLTGLCNKKYLLGRLGTELERFKRYNHPLSLLILDVDAFSSYNESFGHLEGDLLLKKFGGIINISIRKIDFACRFGADEFAVVLPDTDQKTAFLIAKRILNALKSHAFHPKQEATTLHKTTSIGLSAAINSDHTPENLIERASQAMCQAKQDGGNSIVIFNPPIKAKSVA